MLHHNTTLLAIAGYNEGHAHAKVEQLEGQTWNENNMSKSKGLEKLRHFTALSKGTDVYIFGKLCFLLKRN